jgi:hypothetical protein
MPGIGAGRLAKDKAYLLFVLSIDSTVSARIIVGCQASDIFNLSEASREELAASFVALGASNAIPMMPIHAPYTGLGTRSGGDARGTTCSLDPSAGVSARATWPHVISETITTKMADLLNAVCCMRGSKRFPTAFPQWLLSPKVVIQMVRNPMI